MTKKSRLLSLFLAFVMLFSAVGIGSNAYAASTTPYSCYTAVSRAYGKKFPLAKGNSTLSSSELGVPKKCYVKCYGKKKGSSKQKYMLYVVQAKSSKDVKTIKSRLNSYVKNEQRSMNNYLSSTGKKLYKNAKVGSKGKYVYFVMLDTSSNKKAVNAIKKAIK